MLRRLLTLTLVCICAWTQSSIYADPPFSDSRDLAPDSPVPLLLPQFPCGAEVVTRAEGEQPLPSDSDRKAAAELVLKYGNGPLAYSALEPGVRYFFGEGGVIPYARRFGISFILEGVIGPAESAPRLLKQFIKENPQTCVCAASASTAAIVTSADVGHYANQMGEVVDLDLADYSFLGSDRASMRRGYNRLLRGYDIVEAQWSDFTSEEIIAVSENWRKTSGARTSLGIKAVPQPKNQLAPEKELGFLARPLRINEEEPGVRKFFVVTKESPRKLVAYYIFDPMYQDGEVIGYHLNFKRRSPEADKKTEEAVVMHTTQLFQAESAQRKAEGRLPIQYLSMGLLPLFNIKDDSYPHSMSLSLVLRGFERASRNSLIARNTFNFFGHGQFKSRFDGIHRPIYFTTPYEWNARPIFGLMDLCNVRVWGVSPVLQWYFGEDQSESSR